MAGFYILDVPEFAGLVTAAGKHKRWQVHPVRAGYRFIEFDGELTIKRADTGFTEAVWFGCLTAGLDGRIKEFSTDRLTLLPTNAPIVGD